MLNESPAIRQTAISTPVNAKIAHPKYLLLMFSVWLGAGLVSFIPGLTGWVLWWLVMAATLIIVIMALVHIKKLFKNGSDALSENDKRLIIVAAAQGSIIATLLYFFALRKKKPFSAQIALKVGLKTLLINLLYVASLLTASYTLDPLPFHGWDQKGFQNFNNSVSAIVTDVNNLYSNSMLQDASKTRAACTQLKSDVAIYNKKIPAYPDSNIQKALDAGLRSLSSAADDCLAGLDKGDAMAAGRVSINITNGYKSLNDGISSINKASNY